MAGEGEEFSTRDDVPDGDGVGRGGGQDLRLRNPFFNADPYSANCPATCIASKRSFKVVYKFWFELVQDIRGRRRGWRRPSRRGAAAGAGSARGWRCRRGAACPTTGGATAWSENANSNPVISSYPLIWKAEYEVCKGFCGLWLTFICHTLESSDNIPGKYPFSLLHN